jgi:phosphoesterase RecJ-like protein
MHVSQADLLASGASEQDCEGLVNWALGIHGVEATAFFRESSDSTYHVSLRSKGRIDVARIAQIFGGGGHVCASGHAIAGPLEQATGRVLAVLRQALQLSQGEPGASGPHASGAPLSPSIG